MVIGHAQINCDKTASSVDTIASSHWFLCTQPAFASQLHTKDDISSASSAPQPRCSVARRVYMYRSVMAANCETSASRTTRRHMKCALPSTPRTLPWMLVSSLWDQVWKEQATESQISRNKCIATRKDLISILACENSTYVRIRDKARCPTIHSVIEALIADNTEENDIQTDYDIQISREGIQISSCEGLRRAMRRAILLYRT